MTIITIFVAWYLGILFLHLSHEFGHAFFRYVFKAPAKAIEVGKGPQIYSGQFGGLKVQVRLFPLGGFCRDPFNLHIPQVHNVLHALIIFAGGIIINVIEALILLIIVLSTDTTPYNILIFRFLLAVAVLMILDNSIPYSSNSDGRKILLAIKGLLTGNVTREWLDMQVRKPIKEMHMNFLRFLGFIIGIAASYYIFVI
ncbi:site-2 protease family protein [Desulfotruncus alcoholivorax]|uniref:site-2 protease family protein n=1 Tax=Desulfotruncus alcoholivorax TaxID=265477 RepID=UPI0038995F83